MDSIKLLMVFLVIIVFYSYSNNIETFFKQKQGLPFQNIGVAPPVYPPSTDPQNGLLCKDENDLPYSCHGQSVSQYVFDKYKNSSYKCPNNWLLPGNSIYQ